MSYSFSGVSPRLVQWFKGQGLDHLSRAASLFTEEELHNGEATQLVNELIGVEDQEDYAALETEVRDAFTKARALADRANSQFARRPIWSITAEQELKKMRSRSNGVSRHDPGPLNGLSSRPPPRDLGTARPVAQRWSAPIV